MQPVNLVDRKYSSNHSLTENILGKIMPYLVDFGLSQKSFCLSWTFPQRQKVPIKSDSSNPGRDESTRKPSYIVDQLPINFSISANSSPETCIVSILKVNKYSLLIRLLDPPIWSSILSRLAPRQLRQLSVVGPVKFSSRESQRDG